MRCQMLWLVFSLDILVFFWWDPMPVFAPGLPQVDPFDEQRPLCSGQRQRFLILQSLRPSESAFLQPLATDPQTAAVPIEDFDPIAPAIAEHVEMAVERIEFQPAFDQRIESFKTFAHVGGPGGQVDPCRATDV